jgi:hypothetical protein
MTARWEAFSHPLVISLMDLRAVHLSLPCGLDRDIGSNILNEDNPVVSSWSISAQKWSDRGPVTSMARGRGSVRYRSFCTVLVWVRGIWAKQSGASIEYVWKIRFYVKQKSHLVCSYFSPVVIIVCPREAEPRAIGIPNKLMEYEL